MSPQMKQMPVADTVLRHLQNLRILFRSNYHFRKSNGKITFARESYLHNNH